MELTRLDLELIAAMPLQAGDTLIIHTVGRVDEAEAASIRAQVAPALSIPVQVAVAPAGVRFVVCRPLPVDSHEAPS